jgi:hypothetical protein
VYALRGGAESLVPRHAAWFGKPDGMTYRDLFAMLEPLTRSAGAAVWCRQMTLGPALEFCVHSREPVSLPAPLTPVAIPCRGVWPVER